jgi:hypothetical protein
MGRPRGREWADELPAGAKPGKIDAGGVSLDADLSVCGSGRQARRQVFTGERDMSGGAGAKRSKAGTILLGIMALVVGLFALFLFTLLFGAVQGVEFAPHNFSSRTYTLLRIPVLNVQVRPGKRVTASNPLVQHLFDEKILTVGTMTPPEFDLVEERAGTRMTRGDTKHPEMAKIFWPEVQRVAQRRMYTAIPEMFHIASQAESPEELKEALHRHAAAHYLQMARIEYDLGKAGPAIVLLEEAKSYAPTDAEIEQLLTEVKSKAETKPAGG